MPRFADASPACGRFARTCCRPRWLWGCRTAIMSTVNRAGVARYRVAPDKEAPLWNPFSRVTYWWTADEVDANRAYRIAYNGQVLAVRKAFGPGYLACRCVKAAQPRRWSRRRMNSREGFARGHSLHRPANFLGQREILRASWPRTRNLAAGSYWYRPCLHKRKTRRRPCQAHLQFESSCAHLR